MTGFPGEIVHALEYLWKTARPEAVRCALLASHFCLASADLNTFFNALLSINFHSSEQSMFIINHYAYPVDMRNQIGIGELVVLR